MILKLLYPRTLPSLEQSCQGSASLSNPPSTYTKASFYDPCHQLHFLFPPSTLQSNDGNA